MIDLKHHEMRLETTHPSGAEEWFCPTCERRFVMQWPPKYKRIVLNAGDQRVAHSGGKGGLNMGTIQVQLGEESAPPPEEDLPLEHWKSWLESEDASKWWPEN